MLALAVLNLPEGEGRTAVGLLGGSSPNCLWGTRAQGCGSRGSSILCAPGVPALLGWMGECG